MNIEHTTHPFASLAELADLVQRGDIVTILTADDYKLYTSVEIVVVRPDRVTFWKYDPSAISLSDVDGPFVLRRSRVVDD